MHLTTLAIFIISMILLYAASTVYHTLDISPGFNKILRKIDHMMNCAGSVKQNHADNKYGPVSYTHLK